MSDRWFVALDVDGTIMHEDETIDPRTAWPAEAREVAWRHGLRVRLSDHAPVAATFERAG